MQHFLAVCRHSLLVLACLVSPFSSAALLDYNETASGSLFTHSSSGQEQLQQGLEALRHHQFDQALTLASKVIANHPDNFHGHLLLCLTLIAKGDNATLENHLRELSQVSPAYASAVSLNLANYFYNNRQFYRALEMLQRVTEKVDQPQRLELAAKTYESQRRLDQSIESFTQLLEQYPEHDEAMVDLSRLYLVEDKYQQSNRYAGQFLNKHPNHDKAAFNQAISYLLLGDQKKALAGFQAIQAAGDHSVQVKSYTAICLHLNGETSEALKEIQSIEGDHTQVFEMQFIEALLLFRLDNFRDAQKVLDNLEANNGSDPLTHLFLAVQAQHQGKTAELKRELQAAGSQLLDWGRDDLDRMEFFKDSKDYVLTAELSLLYRQGLHQMILQLSQDASAEGSVPASIFRARSQWQLGQTEAARQTYANLINAHPKLITPRLELADIDFHQNHGDRAIKGYETVAAMVPTDMSIQVNLANLYNSLDQVDKAIALYKALLKSAPNNAYLLNQLAATYAEKKADFKNALNYGLKAAKSDPNDLSIKDTLAFTYLNTNELAKARKLYEEILEVTQFNQSPETFYRIARTYDGLGDPQKAKFFYELSINTGHEFEDYAVAEKRLKALWGV